MRLWHYALIPYLPELQFKGQLKELVLIMHQWRDKGRTNHLLINKVMEYPKYELTNYFLKYCFVYKMRYKKPIGAKYGDEWKSFSDDIVGLLDTPIFIGWHNKEYLRVCMANLYEKHFFGVGKSRISDEEWERLCEGYKQITNEEWVL